MAQIECFGADHGRRSNNHKPRVPIMGDRFVQVSAGNVHTCGLTDKGYIECFGGYGSYDRLGSRRPSYNGKTFVQVSAGGINNKGDHTCGMTNRGAIECFSPGGRIDNNFKGSTGGKVIFLQGRCRSGLNELVCDNYTPLTSILRPSVNKDIYDISYGLNVNKVEMTIRHNGLWYPPQSLSSSYSIIIREATVEYNGKRLDADISYPLVVRRQGKVDGEFITRTRRRLLEARAMEGNMQPNPMANMMRAKQASKLQEDKRLKELEEQVVDLQELKGQVSSVNRRFASVKNQVAGIKELKGQVAGVKKQVSSVNRQVASVKNQVAGIKELKGQVAGVQKQVAGVQKQVAGIKELKGQVAGVQKQVAGFKGQVEDLQDLSEKVDAMQELKGQVAGVKRSFESHVRSVNKQFSSVNRQVRNLESKIRVATGGRICPLSEQDLGVYSDWLITNLGVVDKKYKDLGDSLGKRNSTWCKIDKNMEKWEDIERDERKLFSETFEVIAGTTVSPFDRDRFNLHTEFERTKLAKERCDDKSCNLNSKRRGNSQVFSKAKKEYHVSRSCDFMDDRCKDEDKYKSCVEKKYCKDVAKVNEQEAKDGLRRHLEEIREKSAADHARAALGQLNKCLKKHKVTDTSGVSVEEKRRLLAAGAFSFEPWYLESLPLMEFLSELPCGVPTPPRRLDDSMEAMNGVDVDTEPTPPRRLDDSMEAMNGVDVDTESSMSLLEISNTKLVYKVTFQSGFSFMDEEDLYFESGKTQFTLDCKNGTAGNDLCDIIRRGDSPQSKMSVELYSDPKDCCYKTTSYTVCKQRQCQLDLVSTYEVSVEGTSYRVFKTGKRRRLLGYGRSSC